jgi:hypothetical protein
MAGNDDPADEEETDMFVKDQGATASYRILARGRGGSWARTYESQRRAAARRPNAETIFSSVVRGDSVTPRGFSPVVRGDTVTPRGFSPVVRGDTVTPRGFSPHRSRKR